MANLNKVMLIGRLTRDPEIKTFSNGGKVANIGFAVNNRRKNQQSGQWEEVPVWVDLKAFNRDSGRKLADLIVAHSWVPEIKLVARLSKPLRDALQATIRAFAKAEGID